MGEANKCPLCDDTWGLADSLELHMWYRHVVVVKCWCGATFFGGGFEAWKPHLQERGGMVAHYLECHFGDEVPDGREG